MNMRTTLLAAVASLAFAASAYATPVTGQLSLNGYAQAVGSASMGSSTGINFANGNGSSVSGDSGILSSYGGETGSFATLGACNGGACGTIKDIASFATSAPISTFISLTTTGGQVVTFDLTSITNIGHNVATDAVSFTASGMINFTGFESTAGTFFLTAQGDNITSFSATTLAANVSTPEPASLAILGGSLAALGMLRRKKA